jgi:hypothetical protein
MGRDVGASSTLWRRSGGWRVELGEELDECVGEAVVVVVGVPAHTGDDLAVAVGGSPLAS